jgi:hypothetical protein
MSACFISLKAFILFLSPFQRLPFSLLCGLIEGFGHEGVVRDPGSTETYGSQKFSDLLVGLRGWNGIYGLFPIRPSLHCP